MVNVYGTTVKIARNQVVTVNGVDVNLPNYIPQKKNAKITLSAYGWGGTMLSTDFGLQVIYWSNYRLCVLVPKVPGYIGNLCGFGGNMNGNYRDDLKLPNGTIVPRSQSELFGDRWIVNPDAPHLDCVLGRVRGLLQSRPGQK